MLHQKDVCKVKSYCGDIYVFSTSPSLSSGDDDHRVEWHKLLPARELHKTRQER